MSRYTPPRESLKKGGKQSVDTKVPAKKKSSKVKSRGPTPFACAVCGRAFRTELALVTHAADAHQTPVDVAALSPIAPSLVRCPNCGAAVGKRNLAAHRASVHGVDD